MAGALPLFPTAAVEAIAVDVTLLRAFTATAALRDAIATIAAQAPFRHLLTRGGPMSVAMTNCGRWGWHSDARGYRYVDRDPLGGRPWPRMPGVLRELAVRAAARGGFTGFDPDCCLINRYAVGARMGTHRDLDEADLGQPIVSVSIGLPAVFLWYGATRAGAPRRVNVEDGDVLVWGGTARAGFHAVQPVAAAACAPACELRFNLTFRRAK
jgi:alkylated DNA repair protein (DNA oxidative demethylase)